MNEPQFGDKVAHLLNDGLRLDERTLSRLRSARELALTRHRTAPAGVLASVENLVGEWGGWSGVSLKVLAPVVTLVIAVSAIYTWQQSQRAAEVEEIDAALLTSDLPIDAYLDRGFQNFLKTRAEE
jgi:hypothetical protein